MKSLTSEYLQRLKFDMGHIGTIARIAEFQGRQNLYVQQKREVLETLRQLAIVESAESSNRIEGVTAPRNRIQGIVLQGQQPRNRSEQEIAGYRDAMALIHESHRHMPISANVLLQLHQLIFSRSTGAGGHWKLVDNAIVERDQNGVETRIRFRPTPAVQTPQAIADWSTLYAQIIDQAAVSPLVLVPLAVLDFLCIHPFADGNGRVGRLLTLLMLYKFNFHVGSYISLERVIEQSKETYYEALQKSSTGWHEAAHDPYPWLEYFWGMLISAYQEFIDRVDQVRPGHGSKSDQVRIFVSNQFKPFAITEVERVLPNISRITIRQVLNALRAEGKLKSEGRGLAARWLPVKTKFD